MGDVPPLEDTAAFSIDTTDGYVRIEQAVGNRPLYTPAEARDLAADIRTAADRAERETE
ncbi:MAG: hypothetical protein ABEH77_09015 [Halobacteriaceae archaeon]